MKCSRRLTCRQIGVDLFGSNDDLYFKFLSRPLSTLFEDVDDSEDSSDPLIIEGRELRPLTLRDSLIPGGWGLVGEVSRL